MSYLCLKSRTSKIKVKTKLNIVTITKACVTPKMDKGLPVKNRPRNRMTKAAKIEGVNRYRIVKEESRKR